MEQRKTLYWIVGNPDNPEGVRKALEDKGIVIGENTSTIFHADADCALFYGCEKEKVLCLLLSNTSTTNVIKQCGVELKPKPRFKEGDFIANNCGTISIFRCRDSNKFSFWASVLPLPGKVLFNGTSVELDKWRLSTEDEKAKLIKALRNNGKDWNEENKRIVNYKWRPSKSGDTYYLIDKNLNILRYKFDNDSVDKELINVDNCFRTREEAEAMAEKVRELFKKGL